MSQKWQVLATAVAAAAGMLSWSSSLAEPINLANMKAQAPKAEHNITTMGTAMMGDKANLFNGSLEFEHTDAQLPGNSALRVAIVRSHKAGRHVLIRGAFGDWDLEAPRIGGNFPAAEGWINSQGTTARCTQYSAPRYVSRTGLAGGGGGGARTPAGGGAAASAQPSAPVGSTGVPKPLPPVSNAFSFITETYYPHEFWQGNFLHIPGSSGQEVLGRNAGDTAAPSDGNSWPLLTKEGWQLRCLGSLQNGSGEGFIALSPDGTRYRFDWLTTRFLPTMKGPSPSTGLGRNEVMIAATLVTDRFGNTVSYSYSGNKLTAISSSDGRSISINYNTNNTVSSISDGTRSWTYLYSADLRTSLTKVTLPDNSSWEFGLRSFYHLLQYELGEGASCIFSGAWPEIPYTGTVKHPSEATGTFTLRYLLHGRQGVTQYCINKSGQPGDPGIAYWPNESVSQTLVSKSISGPNMDTLNWAYNYSGSPGAWAPCNGCAATKVVTVTDPQGYVSRHTFGTLWRVNEGQLQRVEDVYSAGTNTALRTTTQTYRSSGPWQEPTGVSPTDITDYLAFRHRPMDQRVIMQDAPNNIFTWQAAASNGFDSRARAVNVTKSSSLGFSKTEATVYIDSSPSWVLGLLGSITVGDSTGSAVQESNTYDPTTGNMLTSSSFGRLTDSYTWYPNGLLQVHQDAGARSTTFGNYMRGIAQLVSFPDSTTQSAAVNNLGLVSSLTNQAGTTTGYTYDAMGRLSSVTYPNETGLVYHPTTQVFERVSDGQFGLAGPYWRQTIINGNARTQRFYDAMWRERVVASWDAAISNTSRFVETRYGLDGQKMFTSYVQPSLTTVGAPRPGTGWARDGLGRVFSQFQDSELGLLQTQTAYLSNFQRRVTNPRGYISTFSYQVFDNPAEEALAIAGVSSPEGVSLVIDRDRFGKPNFITRSGSYGGQGLSATRRYVYDSNQRLCKTIEPETGATVQAYDTAGNVAWRASGQSLLSASSCDQSSVGLGGKISYGYDTLNRLTTTAYDDGSPGISRSYTLDGQLAFIVSGSSSWAYGYNNRRLLVSETLTHAGYSYPFAWPIEAHGNVAGLNYPGGPNVAYAPNAFGKPTQVSGFASSVTHHPNGQVAGYTLANGIAHSTTLNARNLPQQWRDAGVLQDLYVYDGNGNVASITDQQEGLATRAMGYDGLDRLTSASGSWGAGSFAYDPLDNLRGSTVGARTATASIDAANRLSSLTVSGIALGFGYDVRGNLSSRGPQAFSFDVGNRLKEAIGKATYSYDGHGRRSFVAYADGKTKLQIYSQAGKLLGTVHSTEGQTRHIYLGDRLIAEVNSVSGTAFTHTDALGSPVARTNTTGQLIGNRTRYEPYGATAAGLNPTGIGFTGHVNDADTGLVYMQQRYYDPIAGRFLSVDPVTTDTNTGRSFNRFAYVENNPYKHIDPDGRELVTIGVSVKIPFVGGATFSAGVSYEKGKWDGGIIVQSTGLVPSGGMLVGKAAVEIGIQKGDVASNNGSLSKNVEVGLGKGGISTQQDTNNNLTGAAISIGPQLGVGVSYSQTATLSIRNDIAPAVEKAGNLIQKAVDTVKEALK